MGCLVLFDFTFYRINLWRNSHSDGIRRLYLYEAIGSSVLFILHFISMILIRVAKLGLKLKKILTLKNVFKRIMISFLLFNWPWFVTQILTVLSLTQPFDKSCLGDCPNNQEPKPSSSASTPSHIRDFSSSGFSVEVQSTAFWLFLSILRNQIFKNGLKLLVND